VNTLFMLCVTKTDLTGISSSLSFQISKVSRYVHLLQTITLFYDKLQEKRTRFKFNSIPSPCVVKSGQVKMTTSLFIRRRILG